VVQAIRDGHKTVTAAANEIAIKNNQYWQQRSRIQQVVATIDRLVASVELDDQAKIADKCNALRNLAVEIKDEFEAKVGKR
jgi:phosphoglycerate-specific signal transduction histidine kinase